MTRTVSSGYIDQRRSSITYPNGRAVEVDWWATGALKSVKDSGAPTAIAAYEWIGGRLGDRMSQNGVELYPEYDAAGRPAYWYHYNLQDESCYAIGFDYTYDRVGNKLSQKSYHDPKDSQRYAYDSASRLTAWVRGGFGQWVYQDPNWVYLDGRCDPSNSQPSEGMTQAQRFDLDGVGNWSLTRTKVDDVTSNETRPDTTFNEYVTVGSPAQTQSYDDNGNLTGDGSKTYKWDAFNRLREVWTAGGSPTKIATYLYDATNRRVRKDLVNNTYTPDIDYYYDGWQIVEEHENGAANPSKQFVFGAYIDEPVVMDINWDGDSSCIDPGGSDRYFYHQNTIYSVYALTDADAALVDVLEYDPYGRHWLLEPGEDGEYFTSDDGDPYPLALPAYASPFLFTGREFDGESGLYCYRHRYYFYYSGSFISRDPLGFTDVHTLYGYAAFRPTGVTDPSGEFGREVHEDLTSLDAYNAGFTLLFGEIIGKADQGVDDNPLTDAFFAGQSRHMLDYQGGEDSRDVWYRTERNKAEELLKSYRPGSCGEAMAAFGRGLHSAQDKISHRPWPGGSVGWRQFIPHPKWWDDYANLGSNEWYDQFWDKYADLHGTRGTDYDTWRGSDPQIASQLEKTDQVEADTWEKVQQFASLVKRYPCCASIALRER